MSFADPAALTVNSVAKNLIKLDNGQALSSEFVLRTDLEEFRLKIRNTTSFKKTRGVQVDRHNVELTHTVFPVSPATLSKIRLAYIVIENQVGDTLTDPTYLASALFGWMTASSNANITKLMNNES